MKIGVKIFWIAVAVLTGCSVYAQEWESSSSPDTTFIILRVDLIGASWNFNFGGTGAENTTDTLISFTSVGDTFEATDTITVRPCDVIHQVFWIENTGGVSLDFNTYLLNSVSGPDWSHDPVNITCASIVAEDRFGGAFSFEPSDGDSATPSAPAWVVLPEDSVGATDEFEDLPGEDPDAPAVDGAWAEQTDQTEYHLKYVMPISSSTTAVQHIYTVITGKISD